MKKKQASITERANAYMERAEKRFRADHAHDESPLHCSFCNGFTWGAVAGYKAGFRAASKKKRR